MERHSVVHYRHTTEQVLLAILPENQASRGLSINMVTWVGSEVLISSFLSLNAQIRTWLMQAELFLYNRGLTKLLLQQDKL